MSLLHGTFRVLLLSLLLPVVAMKRSGSTREIPQQPQESSSADTRKLQQTIFNYRANYTADFQHIADPSCTGDAPVLVVSCLKAQNMKMLGKSSESIMCNPIEIAELEGDTSYVCQNTCNGTACNDIYLASGSDMAPANGPYGSIQFMCEGDDYQQLEAAFNYIGGSNGFCTNAATSSSEPSNRNVHVAKLGISCPSESSGGSNVSEYVYDDTYFECSFTGDSSAAAVSFNSRTDSVDVYTCMTGKNCNGLACSDVIFNNIIIRSVVPKFLSLCVETTLQSITAIPSKAPIIPIVGDTIYSVRFEALWGELYKPETAMTMCRYLENAAVRISCGNGATAIRFHNSTDPSMNCTIVDERDLDCTGDETKSMNIFTSVVYDCFGGTVPTSQLTFPEASVACDNNTVDVLFRNSVMMGLECPGETFRYYSDLLLECASTSHQFYVSMSEQYQLEGDRHICSESTIITSGSSLSDVLTIPSVSIATDSLWLSNPIPECVTIADSIPIATPFVMPTGVPFTSVPVPSPVAIPGLPVPTITVPTVPTFTSAPLTDTKSGINTSVFAVIGGIFGGIIISLVVLFVYKKGKSDGNTVKYNNNATGSQSNGSTDHLTQGNSDHLTRASGSTTKRSSLSAAASPHSDTIASNVQSPRRQLPTTSATVNTSDAYIIEYKDQARSVDTVFPVMDSARCADARASFDDMPIAMAVPMTDSTAAYQGSVINTKQMPSAKARFLDI